MSTQSQQLLPLADAPETREQRLRRILALAANLARASTITTAEHLFDEQAAQDAERRARTADDANHEGPILPILPGPYLG